MERRAYSDDLRGLMVAEVAAGASRRLAARRFKVSASSAIPLGGASCGNRQRRPGGSAQEPLATGAACIIAAETDRRGTGPDPGGD